jgi:hypothetical protein
MVEHRISFVLTAELRDARAPDKSQLLMDAITKFELPSDRLRVQIGRQTFGEGT